MGEAGSVKIIMTKYQAIIVVEKYKQCQAAIIKTV